MPPGRDSTTETVVEYCVDGDDYLTEVGQGWSEFALVSRIRATRKQVRVPLRCDAAHAQRWFEMTVTPEANARVRFQCVLVFEESREPVALLDLGSERNLDAEPIALCS